jgi:DNA gyrase subunit A
MANVEKREITKELGESYLDYAMSVIVARALPDVRDGLKPVHRRVLWDMWETGLTYRAKTKKSANVVGETMARYHPHGDSAIYDTLARMAQDFSLRYPLVLGQGNFGCFTKDTEVRLADGRNLNFGELVEEHEQGKKNYTYTLNKLGLISIAEIKSPRRTRVDAEVITVTLDSGVSVRCTPDHRFMLRDGNYKEAKDLTTGESLMPLYERISEKTDRLQREGYLLIQQPKTGDWVPAHHLADNFNLTRGKYIKSAGRVRHHVNFDKTNNSPDNIQRLQWGEHWRIHYENAKRQHENPEYQAQMHERIVRGNKNHTTNQTGRVKFLKICRSAIEKFGKLDEETYYAAKKAIDGYAGAPLWENGMEKYFENDQARVLEEVRKNHKVIKVESFGESEDVYDLTIENSHNFALAAGIFVHNSVDGDAPAAMRYTEAKMSAIAEELLLDIEKDTVDWVPNYDATRQEPRFFPAKLPNLLLNGTLGIAVGMATSIPPHNLNEVCDAILHLADNADATNEDLLQFVKGPDFPTGGIIYNAKAIKETYITGRGAVTTRAKSEIVENKGGKQFDIVITEIPYQVNKSELIKNIAELAQEKKIEGIRDLRDESDREGMRIVIELKNDVAPQKVLNWLYKHTDLEKNFNLNMIALVNGIEPRLLSIKDILVEYVAHRKEMVKRRTQFDLRKAQEREHILEGLAKALDAIDRVIATIKKSADKDEAKTNLIKQFKLSEIQATAILEMRLQTLAALEHQKIEDELKEKRAIIEDLTAILKSPAKILKIIKDEVSGLKEKYGDERRTQVVARAIESVSDEDLITDEDAIVTVSAGGYIKRLPPDTFKAQKRGGKGLIGSDVADDDFLLHFFSARTHDNVLFFTDRGRVFQTKVHEIPQATRTSKGKAIQNFLELPADENVNAIVNYSSKNERNKFLMMVTKQGNIKKTPLKDFENIRRNGIIAMKLKGGKGAAADQLKWAKLTGGADEVLLATRQGQSIRFDEKQARPMGRTAAGVRAIKLKKQNDEVAGFDIITKGEDAKLIVVMENGFAKQTPLKEYKQQGRGGSGIKTADITPKTGPVVSAHVVTEEKEIFALSAKGQMIRTELATVRMTGRSAQGVRIINLNSGDRVAGTIVI